MVVIYELAFFHEGELFCVVDNVHFFGERRIFPDAVLVEVSVPDSFGLVQESVAVRPDKYACSSVEGILSESSGLCAGSPYLCSVSAK